MSADIPAGSNWAHRPGRCLMTTPPADVLAAVHDMMAANARHRATRAATAWNTMRPYERRLVREAAVMGWVLGYQSGAVDARQGVDRDPNRTPHDIDIVRDVIEHCDSTADLYPYLAAACNGRRRRITRKRLWDGETR